MKKLLLLMLIFAGLQAAAQSKIMQDANATPRAITGSFTEVSVATGVELYLTQGNETSLAVSVSDPKYAERFKTEVIDGVLKIYYDNKNTIWKNEKNRKLKAYLSLKVLERLTVSSGADVQIVNTLAAGNFKLRLSSGSMISGSIKMDDLDVDQSSGSLANLSGTAGNLNIDVSSGSGFKGYNLTSETCKAKASSGGEIKITATKELEARASSGGDIKYKGNASIKNLNVSSGGSVKKG